MIQIGDTIVSLDIFECYFLCDLMQCKGACCVEGESGAPLLEEEALLIKRIYPKFKSYLSVKGNCEIEKQGFSVVDREGDLVTPIIDGKECVYAYKDDQGITKCAIEKSFLEKKQDFRKPISCHLYPIRITPYAKFDAVNYERIDICKSGRDCGAVKKIPLYRFLREPLIRKYGEEWYHQLEIVAREYPF